MAFFRSILFIAGFASLTFAQNGEPAASRPIDEAVIDNKMPVYKDISDKLDDLHKLPAPRVTYSFDGHKVLLVSIAPDAKKILDDHWKAALSYFYADVFLKSMNPQVTTDRNMEWLRFSNRMQTALTQSKIAAPNGERSITAAEASSTVAFVNRVASSVVDKAKTRFLER
jgi:hypothetical protein